MLLECAAAAAVLLAAFGSGAALRPGVGDAEDALVALALGLGILPLLVAAVGFAGLLGPVEAFAIVGAGLALAARPAMSLGGPTLLTAGAAFGLAAVAALPPVDQDALVYHLGLANHYAVTGRVDHVAGTIYAGFPQSASALYALCLLIANPIDGTAAKILSIAHGAVAVAAVAFLGRRGAPKAGAWSAALFAGAPAFLFLANLCGADTVVVAHAACALLALARGETATAGLLAGFGAAAKYQGFLSAAALAAAAWSLHGARPAAVAGALALLPPLPWLAKNLAATGNPIFPLGSLDPAVAAIVGADMARYRRPIGALWRLPYDLVADPGAFETPIGAASVVALGLGIAAARRPGLPRALGIAAGLQAILWAATLPVSRFLLPAVAAAAPAAAAAGRPLRAVLALLLAFQCVTAAQLSARVFRPHDVLLGRLSRGAWAAARNPLVPIAAYADAFLPPDARVLFVGSIRRFPFPREVVAGSPYDEQPIAAHLRAAVDVPDLAARLRAEGITHVVVDVEAAATARAVGALPLGERERAFWNDLAARALVPLIERPPVGLYRLKRPAELATMG